MSGLTTGEAAFRAISSFRVATCVSCGVKFALDEEYIDHLANGMGGVDGAKADKDGDEDGEKNDAVFCCPNGHEQGFVRRRERVLAEEAVKAKRRAEFAEAKTARLEKTMSKLKAERDRLKKKLKAIEGGAPQPGATPRAAIRATGGRRR